ncbi:MAG: helix-turn-helix domain-containing protein [Clostridiales bacterium]|jgi:transcriptional regulator with XRE-family HTH domain|nr:helix-turn-helix domain-containing protein [Clostridiales bacterium]
METNIFKDRLREVRIEKQISQDTLAKGLRTYQANIARWESGKKRPTMNYIIALAKYFNVSADYLLGLEND